jgi:2-polyprenyl-6-methoxyphenol hydroxylase-like FAD-dependent oxidoreductase
MARVIVVGGGPAGASLAFLLADRGVETLLLERQVDFAREFRGELLLPSGVQALEQMGLGPVVRGAPHAEPDRLRVYFGRALALDLTLDPTLLGAAPLAVSQPALLEAIVAEASRRPAFRLLRGASVRDLLSEGGRVAGVRAHTTEGEVELRADLVIGADGRASAVRRRAGLAAREAAPPMDVVWCKLALPPGFRGAQAFVGRGHLLIAYRSWDDRLQVAWAILKGSFGELRRRGIEGWVEEMALHVTPDLGAHLRAHGGEVHQPFLLDVVSDHVTRWTVPGALVVGDAAHTMSPVGAQGLNVALRDAIVAANRLVPALREGAAPEALDLAARAVESERRPEIEALQRLQALPPRVVLQRAWWGEPVRRLFGQLIRTSLGRRLAARGAAPFAFGTTEVALSV